MKKMNKKRQELFYRSREIVNIDKKFLEIRIGRDFFRFYEGYGINGQYLTLHGPLQFGKYELFNW